MRGRTDRLTDKIMIEFEDFWTAYNPEPEFNNRHAATQLEWDKCSQEKQQTIMNWLERHRPPQGRNPYFFVQDFAVRKVTGIPTDYNGRKLPKSPVFSAKYNGKWGMYTQTDIDKYGLERATL